MNTYFTVFSTILILVAVVQIALYIWVVTWMHKISKDERCTCAKNWRRLYIIIFPLISFLMLIPMNFVPESYARWKNYYALPETVGWIVFAVFAFQYLSLLKRMKCECAIKDKSGDNALLTMSVIQVAFYGIAFIAIIMFMAIMFYNLMKNK